MLYERFHLTGCTLVALLHSSGLVLLYKSKTDIPNQRFLTVNLALVEMLNAYCGVVINIMKFTGCFNETEHYISRFIFVFLYLQIRFTVLHMIMDRFLEIHMSLKYPILMTKKKMIYILVSFWIVSLVIAVISFSMAKLAKDTIGAIFAVFILLLLDFSIVAATIFTYYQFYFMVKKIKNSESRQHSQPKEKGMSLITKKFKVPLYIVSTYIIFNFVSSILRMISYSDKKQYGIVFDRIASILDIIGYASDGCIYIYANRNVRKKLKSWLERSSLRFYH